MADGDVLVQKPPDPVVCRHWARTGDCLRGSDCRFGHPEQIREQILSSAAAREAATSQNARNRKQNRGPGRRNQVRNSNKEFYLRRFLVDEFSLEQLRSGSGLLDVAGGKGGLSFELENFSGVASTVIDPRPLNITRFSRAVERHVHLRNSLFPPYNARDPLVDGILFPQLVQMCFSAELATLLECERSECDGCESDADLCGTCSQLKQYIERSMQEAKGTVWTHQGLTDASLVQANPSYYASHLTNLPPDTLTVTTNAVTTAIHTTTTTDPTTTRTAANSANTDTINTTTHSPTDPSQWRHLTEWREVRQRLRSASAVVGLHPDQATGEIVDFALARDLPFAIVPCCVYSQVFPRRRLRDATHVTSYDDLVRWVLEKSSDIEVAELPFEGKNKVIYRRPKANQTKDV